MRKNFRNDLIQLFFTFARASGRTKGRFEVAQLTDSTELLESSPHTALKWELMHRTEQHALFGGQFVKTLGLVAMHSHRLLNEDMNAAAQRGRGHFEMAA